MMDEGDIDVPATLASGRIVYGSPRKTRWSDHAQPAFFGAMGLVFFWASFSAPGDTQIGLVLALFFLLLSGVAVWRNVRSYRIRSIDVPGDREQVRNLALRAAAALGWDVVRQHERSFECHTRRS